MNEYERLLPGFLQGGTVAEHCVPSFYRLMHPDLAGFDDEDLLDHYRTYGRAEGRIASPAAHRRGV